jgi:dolichol-phosphate mannosyltransferase
MATALVTGAGGFVGAALVRHLLARGDDVTAVVRPGSALWRLDGVSGDVRIEAVDLSDLDATNAAVARARPECLFHLAAHGAYSWQDDLTRMIEVNVAGTAGLLDAFLRADGRAFINAGSSSEYGYKDHSPSETERLDPNSHYAITKAAATHFCRNFAQTHGIRAVTLRLYSVYGPWEEPQRLIPRLVVCALDGRYPPLADPATARDFVYVVDVCDAFVRAADVAGVAADAVINIGSARQTTLAELVAVAKRIFNIEGEPAWASTPSRSWDTNVWVADAGLAEQTLGWRAHTTLESGLMQTADWLRADLDVSDRYRADLR